MVSFQIKTRVVVDNDLTEEQIVETAIKNIIEEGVRNYLHGENLIDIEDDEECPYTVNDELKNKYEEFVEKHGHAPKYAHVGIVFEDDDKEESAIIKLRDFPADTTWEDPDDEFMTYYANGLNELLQINDGFIADFEITDLYEFSDTY